MCNLNILVKTKPIEIKEITMFLAGVTSNSFAHNNDGEGFYFDKSDKIIKSVNKINVFDYINEIDDSRFILTHQRISTSGHSDKFLQPFNNNSKEFVLVHNGVMREWERDKQSDTYNFFNDFLLEFKVNKGTREQRVIKAIQILLKDSYGSYSMAIYDKLESRIYYFKNYTTDIHIFRSNKKDVLFMTTDKNNQIFLNLIGKFSEFEIEDYTIYRIQVNKKNQIKMFKVGEITRNYGNYKSYVGYSDDDKKTLKKMFDKEKTDSEIVFGKNGKLFKHEFREKKLSKSDLEDSVDILNNKQLGFIEVADCFSCMCCGYITHNFNRDTGEWLCDDCIDENRITLSANCPTWRDKDEFV